MEIDYDFGSTEITPVITPSYLKNEISEPGNLILDMGVQRYVIIPSPSAFFSKDKSSN
jgi:hypothetical protein